MPATDSQLPGPRARGVIDEQELRLSPSCTRDYPFVADRGEGCWLTDLDGNEFLDFCAGIAVCATGHCHPRVVDAITAQAGRLIHMSGTDFYYGPQGELARKLAAHVPLPEPQRVFFTNSGTEAVEAAIKLARHTTGRSHLIAFSGAFHGRSLGALSLTNSKVVQRKLFGPLLPDISHISYPGRADVSADQPFRELDELFLRKVPADQVAAIFVEPIQGEGGYIVPPPGFHRRLREVCSRHGILLVADEIQSGMGRTGKFCAIEHWNVEPDVVCLAKGIASGMPLGAMIARADLMRWPPGSHGSTFGGNPVACVAALATIELLEEGLMQHAVTMGNLLLERLRHMAGEATGLSGVRGLGLMVAADVRDPQTRNTVLHACFRRGLILLGAGERAIRFCPPLVVTEEEIGVAMQILEQCLVDATRQSFSAAG